MAINIPVRDVAGAQHLRCVVRGEIGDPRIGRTTIGDLAMDVYTGWLVFQYERDDPGNTKVISFVPLGTKFGTNLDIQTYSAGVTSAIVSASVSSFADDPDLAAVDRASVKLLTHNFPGLAPVQVLVLEADVAVTSGKLHRVSYQVTVLANLVPPRPPGTLSQPPIPFAQIVGDVINIDPRSTAR